MCSRLVGPLGSGLACQEAASGRGFLMYSAQSVHARFFVQPPPATGADHFVCARLRDDVWQYDTGDAWRPFTALPTDVLVAVVDFGSSTATPLLGIQEVHGGVVTGYAFGDIEFAPTRWMPVRTSRKGHFTVSGASFSAACTEQMGSTPEWVVGDWGSCPTKCGQGERQRTVQCPGGFTAACEQGRPRPAESHACEDYSDCGYEPFCPLGRKHALNCDLQAWSILGVTLVVVACLGCIFKVYCSNRQKTSAGGRHAHAFETKAASGVAPGTHCARALGSQYKERAADLVVESTAEPAHIPSAVKLKDICYEHQPLPNYRTKSMFNFAFSEGALCQVYKPSDLNGTWTYSGEQGGCCRIRSGFDGQLHFEQRLTSSGVLARGTLRPQSQWLQAAIRFDGGQLLGDVRLFPAGSHGIVLLNFRAAGQAEWGPELVLRKDDNAAAWLGGDVSLGAAPAGAPLGPVLAPTKLGGWPLARDTVATGVPHLLGKAAVEQEPPSVATLFNTVEDDRPGPYIIAHNNTAVTDAATMVQSIASHLKAGSLVNVVEVIHCAEDHRVRGRLDNPAGWISLVNTESGYRWAKRETETETSVGSPSPLIGKITATASSGGTTTAAKETASSQDSTSQDSFSIEATPQVLCIQSPSGQRQCEGMYTLASDERPNGQPMWRQQDGHSVLYSGRNGKWCLGGRDVASKDYNCSAGFIYQTKKHWGVSPDRAEGTWALWNGTEFLEDAAIQVLWQQEAPTETDDGAPSSTPWAASGGFLL